MDCPGVAAPTERREVQCGKYSLTVLDRDGPVLIQGESCGLWSATGYDAKMIIKHLENPGDVEHYLDMSFKNIWEVLRSGCHDI